MNEGEQDILGQLEEEYKNDTPQEDRDKLEADFAAQDKKIKAEAQRIRNIEFSQIINGMSDEGLGRPIYTRTSQTDERIGIILPIPKHEGSNDIRHLFITNDGQIGTIRASDPTNDEKYTNRFTDNTNPYIVVENNPHPTTDIAAALRAKGELQHFTVERSNKSITDMPELKRDWKEALALAAERKAEKQKQAAMEISGDDFLNDAREQGFLSPKIPPSQT